VSDNDKIEMYRLRLCKIDPGRFDAMDIQFLLQQLATVTQERDEALNQARFLTGQRAGNEYEIVKKNGIQQLRQQVERLQDVITAAELVDKCVGTMGSKAGREDYWCGINLKVAHGLRIALQEIAELRRGEGNAK